MMIGLSTFVPGFNMGMRSTSRTCAPTMTETEDYQLLVSRFGPTSQEQQHSRRSALQLGAAAMAALPLASFVSPANAADGMFSLPPLPYAYVRPPASCPNRASSCARTPHALPTPRIPPAGRARAAHRRGHDEVPPRLPPPGLHQQP